MYALVLLKRGPTAAAEVVRKDHEKFIDELVRRNKILLGGTWAPVAGSFSAAYLLHCASLDEAQKISSKDPYVHKQIYEADVVEWVLVGINPNAIDPDCILTDDKIE